MITTTSCKECLFLAAADAALLSFPSSVGSLDDCFWWRAASGVNAGWLAGRRGNRIAFSFRRTLGAAPPTLQRRSGLL